MSIFSKWLSKSGRDQNEVPEYILFVAENCHDCDQLLEKLATVKQRFKIINVDAQKEKPPVSIFAFPALFKNDTLVAYGFDIVKVLSI